MKIPDARFSFRTKEIPLRQIKCHIAHTTPETLRADSGKCSSVRRCIRGRLRRWGRDIGPSIEDKIVRFPEKTRHQFFS